MIANCVNFHSRLNKGKDAPQVVSIALHLYDFFNMLWQEYMIPSDLPSASRSLNEHSGTVFEILKEQHTKREEERIMLLENSGMLVLSDAFTQKMAERMLNFITTGGRVDQLDVEPIFGKPGQRGTRFDVMIRRLRAFHDRMMEVIRTPNREYTIGGFYKDLQKCYTEDVLQHDHALRKCIASRLDRLFLKYIIPLHEANSRGVTRSSIWGNVAAVIWARESSKKPHWPALCLGILPHPDQLEGWHVAVTDRNEMRLPDRLRVQLNVVKQRCKQMQIRQSMSYFLVEFMGTHEFLWVPETNIIENFDPEDDPNKKNLNVATVKKSCSSRSITNIVGSQMYATVCESDFACLRSKSTLLFEHSSHFHFPTSTGLGRVSGMQRCNYRIGFL